MVAARGKCPFLLLLRILFNLIITTAGSGLRSFTSLKFDPPYVHDLMEGKNTSVRMTLGFNERSDKFINFNERSDKPLQIMLESTDETVASVVNKVQEFNLSSHYKEGKDIREYDMNFTVIGHFLGKTTVRVYLRNADDENDDDDRSLYEISVGDAVEEKNKSFDIWVVQDSKRLVNRIFLCTLVILIVIANTLMGCELDTTVVLETVKKPVAPFIGLCTQFIAMPLLAYGIAHQLFMSRGLHSFALGLFVTGCAPGGGASNYWTILLDGNLPVSVTMTFVSTLAALFMMPFWMWALGYQFLQSFHPNAAIKVPYIKIVSSLVTMIVPLLIGIGLAYWKPAFRHKARKFMRPFMIFVLIFLVVFGTIANMYMIRLLTWTSVFGGLSLPWCGFTVGCMTAVFFQQPAPDVTAIAIETGIQNTGIAIMLLKFSFPDPDADISALIPVISASMTPLPLLVMVLIHMLVKHIKKKHVIRRSDLENGRNKDCIQAITLMAVDQKQDKTNEDNPLINGEIKTDL